MPDQNKAILDVELSLDDRKAKKQAAKFQKGLAKELQKVGKASKALGAANAKVTKEAAEDTKEWIAQLGELAKYHRDEIKLIENKEATIEELRKKQRTVGEEEAKRLEGQIQAVRKEARDRKKGITQSVKSSLGFDPAKAGDELKGSLEKAASGFKSSMSSFFAKDVKGLGNNFASIFSKDVMKGLGKASKLKAYKLEKGGAMMKERGAAAKAAGAGGQGALLKGMGAAMGGVGKVMGLLGKILPILGAVSSAVVGIVKLFLDADANVKDFNKSVLESASTSEMLYANMGDVTTASKDLKETLKSVQKASEEFGYQNAWGIMREDHVKILNTLTQEGVSLHAMRKEAEVAGQDVGKFTQELAKVSIAYSKAFGVPLQEINQFQAEMMTEMGMSLGTVKMQFEGMARSAAESGIAANKFFAIIKGVSQDLSLYNVRMESAVKLLKMLGKVMNPRNAQKFMQTATQGLKAMSQDDRLKVSLLTGEKGRQIVAKDLENKRKNLAKDIGEAIGQQADEVQKRLNDPKQAKALWAEVGKKAQGKLGALRESSIELNIDTAASKKGVYGQSFAMENLGMGASMDMMTEALAKFGGGKTLMEGAGTIGMTKMAEMLGYSTEQLRGMMKVEVAVQEQRAALEAQGKEELAAAKTDADRQKAQHKIDIAAQGSSQDILDSMSEEEQKALKDGTKTQEQWAQEQVKQTDSIINKLERLLQFLMNQIYAAINGIYETIVSWFGDDSAEKMYKLQQQIMTMQEGPEKQRLMEKMSQTAGMGAEERYKAMSAELAGSAAEAIRGAHGTEMSQEALDQLKWVFDAGFADADTKRVSEASKRLGVDEGQYGTRQELQQALTKAWALQKGRRAGTEQKQAAVTSAVDKAFQTQAASGNVITSGYRAASSLSDFKDVLEQSMIGHESKGSVTKAMALVSTGTAPSQAMAESGFTEQEMKDAMGLLAETISDPELQASIAKAGETSANAAVETAETLQSKNTAYFALSPNHLKGKYKDTIYDAVLEAVRLALYEYWMYSGLDRNQVAEAMKSGGLTPAALAKAAGTTPGQTGKAFAVEDIKGNQFGGRAVGRNGPLAMMAPPPPGEGYAAIKPGEQITPAYARGGGGGGAQHVVITLDPNAQRMFRAEVTNGIYENKRRERNT